MSVPSSFFGLVIPIPQSSQAQLSSGNTIGLNLLQGIGITAANATSLWNSISSFLNAFYGDLSPAITLTTAQNNYMTNVLVFLLTTAYRYYSSGLF